MEDHMEDHILDDNQIITRQYIANLAVKATSADEYSSLITYISTLEGEALEAALPSLCLLTKNVSDLDRQILFDICFSVLSDSLSSRGGRKACCTCLKDLVEINSVWSDFFIITESLEEPQFHLIRPTLSRWDSIIHNVQNRKLEWRWASVVMIRALNHTNGWIRVWALEKAVEIHSKIIENDYKFVLQTIFLHLNCVDSLWRLLERNKLPGFLESFAQLLSDLNTTEPDRSNGKFIRSLTLALSNISCPQTFFYIATILEKIETKPVLESQDLPLVRAVLNKARYITLLSMRISTEFMLLRFFSSSIIWTPEMKMDFGAITAVLSQDSKIAFDELTRTLKPLWSSSAYDPNTILSTVLATKEIDAKDDVFELVWVDAEANNKVSHLLSIISLEILEQLNMNHPSTNLDMYIHLLVNINQGVQLDNELILSINGYILMKSAVFEGKISEFNSLKNVHIPFLKRFYPNGLKLLSGAISPFVGDVKLEIDSERLALLYFVFEALIDIDKGSDEKLFPFIEKYIGKDWLSGPRLKKSPNSSLSSKEFNELIALTHAASLKLFLRFTDYLKADPNTCVPEAIDVLDAAASYDVKERLLKIIALFVGKTTDSTLYLKAIDAAALVVSEEKKSQNCIPAMKMVFVIGMQSALLQNDEARLRLQELFSEYCQLASLSTTVALVLTNALFKNQELLCVSWAPYVVKAAIFGPVPRKDTKVNNDSYKFIYGGDLKSIMASSIFERLDEVVQRVRLEACIVAINRSKESHQFAHAIVSAILEETKILDSSSSRSFGLSLPHRQKTRAVSVLLFVVEHISDKEVLDKIFTYCIDAISDPCQQFSIKLIVEWILVRMCLKSIEIEKKVLTIQKQVAKKRIGSISSWLNVVVHLYRVKSDKEYFTRLINLIIPWTTAQNFAVRCTAIAAAIKMYGSLSEKEKSNWPLVQGIIEFDAEPAGNSRRIVDNLIEDFYFAYLNMVSHFDMQTVFIEIPSKTGLPIDETIPMSLINELNNTSITSGNIDTVFLKSASLVYSALSKNNSCAPDMEEEETEIDHTPLPGSENALQRKIDTTEKKKKDDCSMIVVASLIDKPNNLGGLCRTSEIFGVESLVIAETLLTQDVGFKALSMSSENWQKIEAVKPADLVAYLQSLRSQGYTVIAAEQTVDSVPMHKFVFPKKCALLMGDERMGVPTHLLQCVDRTVEIEQLGQTRSLNVHVTASLFISKYVEQVLLQ